VAFDPYRDNRDDRRAFIPIDWSSLRTVAAGMVEAGDRQSRL
jgi:sulfate adenylyltransferase subunit 1 (EFTu-like GTPase family)